MTDAIAHRGPDGEGQWCEEGIGLGHRRLAIIDLTSDAAQPMHSSDGRYVITYNGEVYNFRELRRELERGGSQFKSQSDTEVVLEAVSRWGLDTAVRRFNGMFAFAIWDRHERRLLLARDRYGIKPLYIFQSSNAVVFASEPKAIRVFPHFSPKVDIYGLAEYLTFQNILSNRTLLEGLTVFPAGSTSTIDLNKFTGEMSTESYWVPHFAEPASVISEPEAVEELRRLLRQAIDRQLVSDVEVGSFLSGGIDSSTITALISSRVARLKTFTCGFDMTGASPGEAGYDERATAELLSRRFGSDHYERIVGPAEVRHSYVALACYLEEPRVGQSYPNFLAAELASRFVKVCFSGVGGDEIFGGYPWRYLIDGAPRHFAREHFQLWNRLGGATNVAGLLQPVASELAQFSAESVYREFLPLNDLTPDTVTARIHASMTFEARTFLHGLLAVEDRLSMAHGLEVRVPFLDNDLVDFALTLPSSLKIGEPPRSRDLSPSCELPEVGKLLLRRASQEWLPPELPFAAKQGFSGPDGSWFARENASFLRKAVSTLPDDLFNVSFALSKVDKHISGHEPNRLLMWSLLALSAWFGEDSPLSARLL